MFEFLEVRPENVSCLVQKDRLLEEQSPHFLTQIRDSLFRDLGRNFDVVRTVVTRTRERPIPDLDINVHARRHPSNTPEIIFSSVARRKPDLSRPTKEALDLFRAECD